MLALTYAATMAAGFLATAEHSTGTSAGLFVGVMRARCIGIPRMVHAAPGVSGSSSLETTQSGELISSYVLPERPEKIESTHSSLSPSCERSQHHMR